MNIIYFQEHKLCGGITNMINKALWKDVRCWMAKATKGYTSHLQLRRVGKRWYLHPNGLKWVNKVTTGYDTMMKNRSQWVKLKGLPRQDFGVLNV
jgi:hypothetical protein